MNIREIPGAWYGDWLPTGEGVAILPLTKAIAVDLESIPLNALEDLPLYVCITTTPELKAAGQSWKASGTLTWSRSEGWKLDPRIAHGNFGCIFDNNGVLRIIEPAPDQTSQGYRYVAPDNSLVLGDSTILKNGVSSYTDLSLLQDGSLLVGQNHDKPDGVVVWIAGAKRLIQAGECYAIRTHRLGDKVSIYFYDVQPNGLSGWVVQTTVQELAALPAIVAPVPPPPPGNGTVLQAPTVTIVEFEPKMGEAPLEVIVVLAYGGGPVEKAELIVDGMVGALGKGHVTAKVVFNELGQHTIAARVIGPGGSDQTATPRIVTVKAKEPKPMRNTRYYLGPNIAAAGLIELIDSPAALVNVGKFVLYVQEILHNDVVNTNGGVNTSDKLRDAQVYRKLKDMGLPLVIEMGVVKPGDCHAEANQQGVEWAIDLVRENGGEVASIVMDEPLTAAKDGCPGQPMEETAFAVATFIDKAFQNNVDVGWAEAWPHISLEDMRKFLMKLDELGSLPTYLHVDVNWREAKKLGLSVATLIGDASHIADDYGLELGVYFAGYEHSTDDEYEADVLQLVEDFKAATAVPIDHVIIQSWAKRKGTDKQDIPSAVRLAGILDKVKELI